MRRMKSNMFHGTVKYHKRRPSILIMASVGTNNFLTTYDPSKIKMYLIDVHENNSPKIFCNISLIYLRELSRRRISRWFARVKIIAVFWMWRSQGPIPIPDQMRAIPIPLSLWWKESAQGNGKFPFFNLYVIAIAPICMSDGDVKEEAHLWNALFFF